MRGKKNTEAHVTENFAELICSNSLRAKAITNAIGLLKEEMNRIGEGLGVSIKCQRAEIFDMMHRI